MTELLTIVACTILVSVLGNDTSDIRTFPEDFQFGVATAAYQIEGAWNEKDKSESIWDRMCHQEPSPIADGTSGDVAADSYHNYKKDVQMMRDLGVDFYRFSISWPRILPTGFTDYTSKDGYEYYSNLIDELLNHNIQPMVTIYHWDLPQRLQDLGGWANPLIVDWFEDYARVMFQLFGDRVKTWITINEPKQICVNGYGQVRFAPALDFAGIAEYYCAKNLLLAHARAWHVYDKEFRASQNGSCGIAIDTEWTTAASEDPNDIEAGLDAMQFEVGLYAHPIFTSSGGFPERVITRVAKKSAEQGFPKSRLPVFNSDEINYVKGTSDFYGFNHYSTSFVYRNESINRMLAVPSFDDDMGVITTFLEHIYDFESGALSYLKVIPFGIRYALNFVRTNYNNPRIIITENGFSSYGGLDDDARISYYRKYLYSVLDAIDDGCNVKAYTAWSLMDNFEWSNGLSVKFGLFEVDYASINRTRIPRKSAYVYKEVIRSKKLDLNYVPVYPTNIYY